MTEKHYHTEIQVATYEVEMGDEIVMYSRVECSTCGEGIRNEIISRRPKPKEK